MYLNRVFFTTGGAEAVEHAVRFARQHTGGPRCWAANRSYHGGTGVAIGLTGEPRRWGTEPTNVDVVRFFGPYPYRSPWNSNGPEEETAAALAPSRWSSRWRGPQNIAGLILESVVGTNGVLVPPPGYLAGVRELCTRYGIVYIADEVMVGFGRTGHWFRVPGVGRRARSDHVRVGCELRLRPARRSGDLRGDRAAVRPHSVSGRSDLLGPRARLRPPVVASIRVFERDDILGHVRAVGEGRSSEPGSPSWVRRIRSWVTCGHGVLWAVELVTDKGTREP